MREAKLQSTIKMILIRAAYIGLLFFLLPLASQANAIQAAQTAFLNKDRKKAITVLVEELNKNNMPARGRASIKKTLSRMTTMFLAEKAMKRYGLAESVRISDAKLSILTLIDLMKVEPHHAGVEKLLASHYLHTKKCNKAEKILTESLQLNPYNEELQLLLLNTYLCDEDFEKLTKALSEFKGDTSSVEFNHLMAVYSLKAEDAAKYSYYYDKLKGNSDLLTPVVLSARLGKRPSGYEKLLNNYVKTCKSNSPQNLPVDMFYYCDFQSEMVEEQAKLTTEEPLGESI